MPRTAANTTNPAPASDPALRPGTMAGTGFFVNDTTLVTAGAVLDRCARLALRDGSALDMIAGDGAAGLAVLTLGRGTGTWLPVDPKARPGAGQPVIVVGYPDGDAPFSTRIDGHVTGAAPRCRFPPTPA